MTKMELRHPIRLVTPVHSPLFVVRQDILVCQMDYVGSKTLSKWAPVQINLGLGEAVSDTAVSRDSYESICTSTDLCIAAGSNDIFACKPQSKGNYCCGTSQSCCNGGVVWQLGTLAQASTVPFTTLTQTPSSTTESATAMSSSTLSTSLSVATSTAVQTSATGMHLNRVYVQQLTCR